MTSTPVINVKKGDVLKFASDVLILKYAQGYYGADQTVASLLKSHAVVKEIAPFPGKHVLVESNGLIASASVVFLGVPDLNDLDYAWIRAFARDSLRIIKKELPETQSVSMTVHGVGFGLDERESFLAQIGGLVEAIENGAFPENLRTITIVERDSKRVPRLQSILREYLPRKFAKAGSRPRKSVSAKRVKEAGVTFKPSVFVAMPFAGDMKDVYIYGIEKPVHKAGYLCERVDLSVFTGDILERVKSKIESASLVIADVTGANANVYLEVGYAWGKDRPTLLLAKKADDLKFDVRTQRCIIYESINDLEKNLKVNLAALRKQLKSTK